MISLLKPIPQDQTYHDFADKRGWLGAPNAMDFWSNLPFVIAGVAGAVWLAQHPAPQFWIWMSFFIGVALVGVGSAYYHLKPCDATLVWDRLPMTIAFMSLFSGIVAERCHERLGLWLLVPLLIFGIGSIVYWRYADDLRWYALVQFGPMLVIPILLLVQPSRYIRTSELWIMLAWYVGAKVLETFDKQIFNCGHIMSGHSLKHVAAAIGCAWLMRALQP
jgi:hypothetical protein